MAEPRVKRTEPVRLYTEDDRRLPSTVAGQLRRQRAELSEQLAAGSAADWADYKHRAGVILGIDQALEICTEAEQELNGR